MKSLKILIKLENQRIDELRKELNVFLDGIEKVKTQHKELTLQLKSEASYVTMYPEAKAAYDAFAMATNYRLGNLKQSEMQLDEQVTICRNKISDAFGDLKKYEILLERKQVELAKEIADKEQLSLDEMGQVLYLRSQKKKADDDFNVD
jgi:flagellar FliJ protein